MKYALGLVVVVLLAGQATAQSVGLGLEQNPVGLRWQTLRTPHFRVIFPRSFTPEALRVANTLEAVYEPVSAGLNRRPRRIPILLQNQTTVSNGFVSLLPRRSEFFAQPPQDPALVGTNDWLDLLAVHEFRHVVQFEKSLAGLSRLAYWLSGNYGLALVNLGIPDWFTEGDAVVTETALTPSGRGRIPRFSLELRTQLLTRGSFEYPKAYVGSLRNFVPDWYVLGYHLAGQARRRYGADVWTRVLDRYYRFPYYPFSFSSGIRRATGLRVEDLYIQGMNDLRDAWQDELRTLPETPAEVLPTARNAVFTNYQFPQYLPDGRLVALKSGLADIQTFVTLNPDGTETPVFQPGLFNNAEMLSVEGKILVWAERHPDPRWQRRDVSVLKSMDVDFRNLTQLTRNTRLAAPALSPDRQRLVAVETSTENTYALVLLNALTGEVLRRLPNPENAFYQHPRFTPDGRGVVAVRQTRAGKTLEWIDAETGTGRALYAPRHENVSHPVVMGQNGTADWILYNSPYSGVDNVYALRLSDGERFQVTSRKFGAYNPDLSPDGRTLAFQDFTPDGFRIATMPADPTAWKPLRDVRASEVRTFGPLVQQEGNRNVLDRIPTERYPVRRYGALSDFRLYGWGLTLGSTGTTATLGLDAQNLLGTAAVSAGYAFNANERTGRVFGGLTYQGAYPMFDVSVSSEQRRTQLPIDRALPIDSLRSDSWRQNDLNLGLRLPLNLTRSKYLTSLEFGGQFNLIQSRGYQLPDRYLNQVGDGTLQAITATVAFSRFHRQAPRDLFPRWGQLVNLYVRSTPFGGDLRGNLTALSGGVLVPGLARHHGLLLRGGIQTQGRDDSYVFASPVLFPRGYAYASFNRLWTGLVDYRFPLLYPDLSLGRFFFIQRVKANVFADYGQGYRQVRNNRGQWQDVTRTYQSVGLDLSMDFNFMRLRQRLELGVRGVYLVSENRFVFQPLILDIGF
jgi:hypothetical protein